VEGVWAMLAAETDKTGSRKAAISARVVERTAIG
jgi:hypothetical protein